MPLYDPALRYLLAVMETGSINAAARKLYVAGSAISRQIGRLEREAGAPLFERVPSGVVPTEAGRAFAGYARRTIQEAGHLIDEIHQRATADIPISLAAADGVGHDFLPRLAAEYGRVHSGARFVLHITEPRRATQMVRDGEADLAVTFSLAIEGGVRILHSRPAPLKAVMRPGHPLASSPVLGFADLLAYPVAVDAPRTTNRHLFDIVAAASGRAIEPVFECGTSDALVKFIRAGDAVTLLGLITVHDEVAAGTLVAVPMREKELRQRSLQVQSQAGRALPAALAGFADFLVAGLDRQEI